MTDTTTQAPDAAALAKTNARLVQQIADLQAREAKNAARKGVDIAYAEGVTKSGKAWRNVSISGGDMGWPGIKLTPTKWERLLALSDDIDAVMDECRHEFD